MVEGAVAGGGVGAGHGLRGAVERILTIYFSDISTNVIQNAVYGSILHGVVQKGRNVISPKLQKRGATDVKNADAVAEDPIVQELNSSIRGALEGNEERAQFVGNAIYEIKNNGSISIIGAKDLPIGVKQIYRSSSLGRGATSPFATIRSATHSLLRSYTPLQLTL
jgi:hypothetical protein